MNLFTISIVIIMLISQKIFLLNEEFLIFLCFLLFFLISYEKIGNDFRNFFKANTDFIKNSLENSFNQYKFGIKENLYWNFKLHQIFKKFVFLKIYYLKLNNNISLKFNKILNSKKKSNFYKKLNFFINLENQFLKLIMNLILEKIYYNTLNKNFYLKNCKVKKFITFNKISFREYIEIL